MTLLSGASLPVQLSVCETNNATMSLGIEINVEGVEQARIDATISNIETQLEIAGFNVDSYTSNINCNFHLKIIKKQ